MVVSRFIKRTCGWCKEHNSFVPNTQLSALVVSFRRLCEYLKTYLSTEPGAAAAATNPTELIIRELALESFGQDVAAATVPVEVSFKTVKRSMSPLVISTSPTELDRKVEIMKSPSGCLLSQPKDEDQSAAAKKKRKKNDSLGKCVDSVPGTSCSSPSRTSQTRSVGFSPQSSRYSSQSSPGCAGALTDASLEAEVIFETIGGEAGHRLSYFGDNVVLSEHDYNKNVLSTPNSTTGSSRSGIASLPTRGQLANRRKIGDGYRRNKKNNGVVVVAEPTNFVDKVSSQKKTKSATIRQIVEAKQFLMSDASLSNEDDSTLSPAKLSPANHSEVHPRSSKAKSNNGRAGCRCAMSKPNPGTLTCRGQRCPCYSAFKGCDDCKCRGCHNNRGDPRSVPSTVQVVVGQYGAGDVMKRSPNTGSGDLVGRVTLT